MGSTKSSMYMSSVMIGLLADLIESEVNEQEGRQQPQIFKSVNEKPHFNITSD